MLQAGPALKVSVPLNNDTGSTKGFLYQEALQFLQERGIEGATALRAYAGYGGHPLLHSSDRGRVAGEHVAVLIYFVDETTKVRSIIPDLIAMVSDGLVEVHPTEI